MMILVTSGDGVWVQAEAHGEPLANGSITATAEGYAASNGFPAGRWMTLEQCHHKNVRLQERVNEMAELLRQWKRGEWTHAIHKHVDAILAEIK